MHVNAGEDQMIDQTVDGAAFSALPIGQAGELAVRIVQRVGADVKQHAGDVCSEIAIEIEMPGNDSENTTQKRDRHRRHAQLREKLCEDKPDLSIEIEIENAFRLAHLVSGFEGRWLRDLRSHQELILSDNSDTLQRNRKAAALIFESALSVSSRILSASSRSARVCLAVTQARKQILL